MSGLPQPDLHTAEFASVKTRYRLTSPIASGATATVWRARDLTRRLDVAIKRFHPHLLADPVSRQRIEHEAQSAQLVSHANVVSVVDTISTDDDFALVFPFVPGQALTALLESKQPLPPREAAGVGVEIADALAAAHAAGVVHRDVKPGNILIGADGRARLLDFGISRSVSDAAAADGGLTGAGLAIGTLPYMAPEQLTADPPTPAADVFALGVVLYEMLAGRRPFSAASPAGLISEHQIPPARIDGVPELLMGLVLSALDPNPAARPSAAQLARSLRGWLDDRVEPEAATALVALPLPAHPERTRVRAAVAMGALLVVAALVAVLLPGTLLSNPGAPPASPIAAAVVASPTVSPKPSPTSSSVAIAPAATPMAPAPARSVGPTSTPAAAATSAPKSKHHGGHHKKKPPKKKHKHR